MSLTKIALTPVAVAILIAAAVSCGGSGTEEVTPTAASTPEPTATPVNPQAALEMSGRVMEETGAFHFRLHHESGSMELTPGLLIEDVEGDIVKPDTLSLSFKGSAGGIAIRASIITLGESAYMTNPLTGAWEAGPTGTSPLGFFDPSLGIAAMMQEVSQVRLLGADLDDRTAYSIAGLLPASALAPLVGATLEESTVSVEMTIDSRLFYLLEVRIVGHVTLSDDADVVRVITLSAFGEPVSIKAPL